MLPSERHIVREQTCSPHDRRSMRSSILKSSSPKSDTKHTDQLRSGRCLFGYLSSLISYLLFVYASLLPIVSPLKMVWKRTMSGDEKFAISPHGNRKCSEPKLFAYARMERG